MLAFIHVEKAAGLSLNSILRRRYGARHCYVEPWTQRYEYFSASDLVRLSRFHPKLESIAGHPVKPYSDLDRVRPDIRYYTFVREPIARCASHYQYQIQAMKRRISFDEWIRTPVFRNFQVKKFAGKEDVDLAVEMLKTRVLFVGLVERFDESLVLLKRALGDRNLNIAYRRQNVASDNSIARGLLGDAQTRASLIDANRLDMEFYDRVCKEIYPRQAEQYGDSLEHDVEVFLASDEPRRVSLRDTLYLLQRNIIYRPILYAYRFLH